MRITNKKRAAVVVSTAALTLGVSGVAFAYFTSSGTGSGSATSGSSTAWHVTSAAATGGALYPGQGTDTVVVTVQNNGSGNQKFSALSAAVANSDGTTWTAVSGCSAADYTVTVPAITAVDLTPGQSTTVSVTVSMNDRATNQDACQGASVPLYFSAS